MRGLISLSGVSVCLLMLEYVSVRPKLVEGPLDRQSTVSLAGIALAASGPATAPTPTATVNPTFVACIGNCNEDAVVAVNELIAGVNIALGNAAVSTCPAFDRNHNGMVEVSELIAGVNNLLYGCGFVPPTPPPTGTVTPTSSPSITPTATTTPPPATATHAATPSATRTFTRTPTNTRTPTATPTPATSVCGGLVSSLPVVCNLTVIPNPVSRSGTIAFRFGISDLNGDIIRICIQLTYPLLEPQTTCTNFNPTNRLTNAILTTAPVSASPLQFGTYQAALQAFDAAGHLSNVITATFVVQ